MKRIALALLLIAAPLQAQTHFSIGLENTGALATEVTHRVRTSSLPGALYFGIGNDAHLTKQLRLTTRATVMLSSLEVDPCDSPCAHIDRYNYRPTSAVDETPFWLVDTGIGLRYALPHVLELAAGAALPIVVCNYRQCGASPMLVWGGFAEARAEVRVKTLRFGLEAGTTIVPAQAARFTVLSEYSGFKQNGQPFVNGRDPKSLVITHLGIVVER